MSCPHTATAKCLLCTHTPAALAAKAQLREYTIHASAQRFFDVQAAARDLRVKASSRSRYGAQLHGDEFDAAVTLLRGQPLTTIEEVLTASGLNQETRLSLKISLFGTRY